MISIPDVTRLRLTGTCSPEHIQAASPQELQKMLDELEASRSFAETRTWENLQELRWVLKDIAGMAPARKTIDLEGRLINGSVWNAIRDRQNALHELVHAIHEYRKLSEGKPLT